VSWLALLLLFAPLAVGFKVHATGRRVRALPADVKTGVVLGALVFPDGTPASALVDRVKLGVELLRRGALDRLVLSGGSPDTRPTEAAVMAQLARTMGAPQSALVLESASRSTFDNARNTAALLAPLGITQVALITCDFHVARASAQFRAHGLTTWVVPSVRQLSAANRLMVTFKEVIAFARRPWLLFR